LGFIEIFEIGIYQALWNFGIPILSILVWLCVVVGFVIQTVLSKKAKNGWRYFFVWICVIGAVIAECIWQVMADSDWLTIDICYFFVLCALLGSAISVILSLIRKKR